MAERRGARRLLDPHDHVARAAVAMLVADTRGAVEEPHPRAAVAVVHEVAVLVLGLPVTHGLLLVRRGAGPPRLPAPPTTAAGIWWPGRFEKERPDGSCCWVYTVVATFITYPRRQPPNRFAASAGEGVGAAPRVGGRGEYPAVAGRAHVERHRDGAR